MLNKERDGVDFILNGYKISGEEEVLIQVAIDRKCPSWCG